MREMQQLLMRSARYRDIIGGVPVEDIPILNDT